MWGFKKNKKPNADGVNLLASILIRYPEITTISYKPDNEKVEITFTLKKPMTQEDFDKLANFIGESIAAYHTLEGYCNTGIDFSMEVQGELGFFHVERDLKTLSRGEITLVASLIKEHFGEDLVMDYRAGDGMDPDFRAAQEETIDRMFGSVQQIRLTDALVGIREEDHVVVFDR